MEPRPKPLPKLRLEQLLPNLTGRRVMVRVDWNVPMSGGEIQDDARIRATIPTLRAVLGAGASVLVATHLGRPKGEVREELSTEPLAKRAQKLLAGVTVRCADAVTGPSAIQASAATMPGQITVLQNLRFAPGETANDPAFALDLASLCDIYCNDAFGTCHRAHASVTGVPQHRTACAGLLLSREIEELTPLLDITRESPSPPRPFALLTGGAKVKDKVALLESLIPKLDVLLIGGAMAYTFLVAQGQDVGRSRVETERIDTAKSLLALAEAHGTEVLLPTDHVVAASFDEPEPKLQVESTIPPELMGLDIGPETATRFRAALQKSGTIVWNGPLGVFEKELYSGGTRMIAQTLGPLARNGKTVVLGGGETVEAARRFGVDSMVTHASTGGGAFLSFLSGKTLPGIAALRDAEI
ncbi:MAG: phosphoglycerate kinase [Planctomycetota bacterium]